LDIPHNERYDALQNEYEQEELDGTRIIDAFPVDVIIEHFPWIYNQCFDSIQHPLMEGEVIEYEFLDAECPIDPFRSCGLPAMRAVLICGFRIAVLADVVHNAFLIIFMPRKTLNTRKIQKYRKIYLCKDIPHSHPCEALHRA